MDKKSLRIVYMGTPEFAVEPLKRLVEGGYNVVGCITMPDKEAGRGHHIQFSPVKEYALSQNIPLLQPEKLKDEQFLSDLRNWKADIQIVVAFRMLPEVVWNMPRLGTFNLHASLLPQYRGAAPINWAVVNGEKETGVTTFFLTHEIDTGKIIRQKKLVIGENDCVGDVHDRLMDMGADLVTETMDIILGGDVTTYEQKCFYKDERELKPAPKIFKETCRINWNQDVKTIHNFVRGFSPYPAAWCNLIDPQGNTIIVKIFETEKIESNHNQAIGSFKFDKKFIDIAVNDGYIRIKSLQIPGKKRLSTEEFLRGFKLTEEYKFE
ncbi:MAG: methionyl-tRNA formyltransferase [Paludibacteraceae bacterium]|nr:methionyl-tRNA formyltransferase [Paludibacteraceae bacterium]